jgi:RNA polymerase sigma factor (sigma-70 family)
MSVQQAATAITGSESLHGGMAEAAENNEHLLVAEAKAGRSSAFGELYERHRSKVYRSAYRILRHQEDAEDAAQRAFQRAFTNLRRFRGDSTFSTWLTRIAINEALMLLRQRRAAMLHFEGNSEAENESCVFDPPDKGPTPEETHARNEVRSTVNQAISKLRKNLRTVAVLRELHELTSAEIAQRLGLSLGAVKARTFHARRILRHQLEQKLRRTRPRAFCGNFSEN